MDKQNVVHFMTEYYSVIKRKEALTRATTWMNLEHVMLMKASNKRPHTIGSVYMKCPRQANS